MLSFSRFIPIPGPERIRDVAHRVRAEPGRQRTDGAHQQGDAEPDLVAADPQHAAQGRGRQVKESS